MRNKTHKNKRGGHLTLFDNRNDHGASTFVEDITSFNSYENPNYIPYIQVQDIGTITIDATNNNDAFLVKISSHALKHLDTFNEFRTRLIPFTENGTVDNISLENIYMNKVNSIRLLNPATNQADDNPAFTNNLNDTNFTHYAGYFQEFIAFIIRDVMQLRRADIVNAIQPGKFREYGNCIVNKNNVKILFDCNTVNFFYPNQTRIHLFSIFRTTILRPGGHPTPVYKTPDNLMQQGQAYGKEHLMPVTTGVYEGQENYGRYGDNNNPNTTDLEDCSQYDWRSRAYSDCLEYHRIKGNRGGRKSRKSRKIKKNRKSRKIKKNRKS
jgi:hypothetical protein